MSACHQHAVRDVLPAQKDGILELDYCVVRPPSGPMPPQSGAAHGGRRGYRLDPRNEAAVFAPKYELDVVHGPVKTQFGYHLIEITERS